MSELESRLDFLESELIRNNASLRSDFNKFITEELIDAVRDKLTEIEEIQSLIEDAVKKTPLIEELKTVRHLYHDNKKELGELRVIKQRIEKIESFKTFGVSPQIKSLADAINELFEITQKQSKEISILKKQLALSYGMARLSIKQSELMGLSKKTMVELISELKLDLSKDINFGRESQPEPEVREICVKQCDIANQGEIVVDRPRDFKRVAFRNSVKLYGISKRALAEILGVSVNTPDRIKGRLQDWIAEKHPEKPVYVKVRLVKYGKNKEDVILYFPLFESYSLLQIPQSVTEPWLPSIRQAVLNGTAKIID